MAKPELRVLMICMGNICRSPTAEAVLRAKLASAGLAQRVAVDSAGTHGYHAGAPPDDRAQAHARRRGYDLSRLRARRLVPQDLKRFDLALAMDDDNLAATRELQPAGASASLRLLMEFAQPRPASLEVPDPYYGAPQGFDHVLDLVEAACDGLVLHLAEHLRRV